MTTRSPAAMPLPRPGTDRSVEPVERYIQRLVDAAPPLSPEQRDCLALLLRGAGATR